jgi:hypothetical protein
MKKTTILILSFLLIYSLSKAQTQKGTQTLGLSTIYTHSSNSYTSLDPTTGAIYGSYTQVGKTTDFSIMPTYSYFIANGSELGGGLSYSNHKSNYNTSYSISNDRYGNDYSSELYGASIFFRKYVLFTEKFGFRTGPFAGYRRTMYKNESFPTPSSNGNYTTNGYNIGATFDLVYYPFKKMGLAANIVNLGYYHEKPNNVSPGSSENENFSVNFISQSLNLSIFYVIGSK